jgi:hypothetical protein
VGPHSPSRGTLLVLYLVPERWPSVNPARDA